MVLAAYCTWKGYPALKCPMNGPLLRAWRIPHHDGCCTMTACAVAAYAGSTSQSYVQLRCGTCYARTP